METEEQHIAESALLSVLHWMKIRILHLFCCAARFTMENGSSTSGETRCNTQVL